MAKPLIKTMTLILVFFLLCLTILTLTEARQGRDNVRQVDLLAEGRIPWESLGSNLVSLNSSKKKVFYLKFEENGQLSLFQKDISGGEERGVVKNHLELNLGEIIEDLSVSRDGTRIAFKGSGVTQYYPSDIYIVNSDGSGLKKLTKSIEDCQRIFYSPEGIPGGMTGTYYCNYHSSPLISPDGKRVLFTMQETRWVKGPEGKEEDKYFHSLCVVNSDGSSFKKLIEAEDRHVGIAKVWSNDSRRVYSFEVDELIPGRYPPLYLVEYDVEKGTKSRVTEVPRRSGPPLVLLMSPVEEKIYYYSDHGLTEYDLLTGRRRVVTEMKLENLAVSPSGDKLVGSMDNRLYLIRITDGRTTPLEVAAKQDPLELSKLKPLPKRMDRLSAEVRGLLKIQSLQWVDERRVLCVITNEKVQRIGILTLSQ